MVRLTYQGYTCLITGFALGIFCCMLIAQVKYSIANKKFQKIMEQKRKEYENQTEKDMRSNER